MKHFKEHRKERMTFYQLSGRTPNESEPVDGRRGQNRQIKGSKQCMGVNEMKGLGTAYTDRR